MFIQSLGMALSFMCVCVSVVSWCQWLWRRRCCFDRVSLTPKTKERNAVAVVVVVVASLLAAAAAAAIERERDAASLFQRRRRHERGESTTRRG